MVSYCTECCIETEHVSSGIPGEIPICLQCGKEEPVQFGPIRFDCLCDKCLSEEISDGGIFFRYNERDITV